MPKRNGSDRTPDSEIALDTPEASMIPQESIDVEQDDLGFLTGNETFIDDIPARPGMAQQWVRIDIGGVADDRNLARAQLQGWRPRLLETIPGGAVLSSIKHPRLGNVVGIGSLVLFEMPKVRYDRIKESYRVRLREQLRAVNNQLERETNGRIRAEPGHSSSILNRNPSFANDDT